MKPQTRDEPDWPAFIRDLGRQVRRARLFLGMSQEELARRADVSQGGVSRVEAGRGLGTPLVTFLKLHLVVVDELRALDPEILSDEMREIVSIAARISPPVKVGYGRDLFPLVRDPDLERLIELYRELPERERAGFVAVMNATAATLVSRSRPSPTGTDPSPR